MLRLSGFSVALFWLNTRPADLLLRISVTGGSVVKNPPAKQEMWVRSLGREDSLEKEMATHSSILALEIPWTKEPGGLLLSMGCKELDTT